MFMTQERLAVDDHIGIGGDVQCDMQSALNLVIRAYRDGFLAGFCNDGFRCDRDRSLLAQNDVVTLQMV